MGLPISVYQNNVDLCYVQSFHFALSQPSRGSASGVVIHIIRVRHLTFPFLSTTAQHMASTQYSVLLFCASIAKQADHQDTIMY
jgi:hypothetical protein